MTSTKGNLQNLGYSLDMAKKQTKTPKSKSPKKKGY